MNLKKYEAFIKAVEKQSISKAALELGNTQSSVTQLINSLEKDFGFKLMSRNKGGIKLTKEGIILYDSIKNVLDANKNLMDIVSDIKNNGPNIIRISMFKSIAVHWMPCIMKEFQNMYPDTIFKLYDGCYSEVENYIRSGEVDIGFVSMPVDIKCECIEIAKDRLLGVLPIGHPYAKSKTIPIAQFEKEPVVSLIDSTDRDARRILISKGINPDIKFKTADDYAMLSMVENGLGICIAHELVLKNDNHKIATVELDPPAFRTIGIAGIDLDNAKPIVRKFIEYLIRWAENNSI